MGKSTKKNIKLSDQKVSNLIAAKSIINKANRPTRRVKMQQSHEIKVQQYKVSQVKLFRKRVSMEFDF